MLRRLFYLCTRSCRCTYQGGTVKSYQDGMTQYLFRGVLTISGINAILSYYTLPGFKLKLQDVPEF